MGAHLRPSTPDRRADETAAVLFDLDGVLWDSSAAHEWAFTTMCRAEGLEPVSYEELAGRTTSQAWEVVLDANGRSAPPEDLDRLTRQKQHMARERLRLAPPLRPDAPLVASLARSGMLVGLVTGSSPQTVELFLAASGLTFDVVVNGGSVPQGKPSPAPYAAAAAHLGVPAEECWALEDSDQGLRSALGAGARAAHLRAGPASCDGGHVPVRRCVGGIAEFVDLVLEGA